MFFSIFFFYINKNRHCHFFHVINSNINSITRVITDIFHFFHRLIKGRKRVIGRFLGRPKCTGTTLWSDDDEPHLFLNRRDRPLNTIDLRQQLALEMKIIEGMKQSYGVVQQINDLRNQLQELQAKVNSDPSAKALLDALNSFDTKAAELVAVEQQWPPVGIVSAASLNGALGSLLLQVEGADSAPTAQAASAFATYKGLLDQQFARWTALKEKDLPALNTLLQQRQLPALKIQNIDVKPGGS